MQLLKTRQGIEITLPGMERKIFEQVFQEMVDDYDAAPGDLEEKGRAFWHEPRGILEHGYEGEREYWTDHLSDLKDTRSATIKKWLQILRQHPEQSETVWKVKKEEIEPLLQILNDRRLFLAITSGVSEEEMDNSPEQIEDVMRREILSRIHLLAVLMEMVMLACDDEPGGNG